MIQRDMRPTLPSPLLPTILPSDKHMQRKTNQRSAIQDAFRGSDRPLAPQEVLDSVLESDQKIGIANVYRNIKTLVEQEWLIPVEIPGEPSRYEVNGKRHHHHFVCRACGRVYDIEGCPGHIEALTPKGFEVADHAIFLYGKCAVCR